MPDSTITEKTRGFITIATGEEKYYRFAVNLLMSYRLYCPNPMPFAIMCDQENTYTAEFDQAVLFRKSEHPYFDKFELLKLAPYDETIFIDADCLAYGDLNEFWAYFAGGGDFTAAGMNFSIDDKGGLFQRDEIGQYRDRVFWKPSIHGGLYFIRKGTQCDAIYKDCQNIAKHYDAYRWPDYCAPYADEPVLCLAMAANGCRALDADPRNYGIPWEVTEMDCDILTGKCSYATEWHPRIEHGRMIHWSVRYCGKPLYRFEVEKLNLMLKHHSRPPHGSEGFTLWEKLLYVCKLRLYGMRAWELMTRIVRKLARILTRKDNR